MRGKYDVPIPSNRELFGPICKDKLAKEKDRPLLMVEEGIREGLIDFWRRNRMNYPRPLTADERRRKRLREEEEEQERRGTSRRLMIEKFNRDCSEFDPTRIFLKTLRKNGSKWRRQRKEELI